MKAELTIKDLKDNNLIIFETIAGSRAYGTNLPHSDHDIRGVFILPDDILTGKYSIYSNTEQIADSTNDTVYYELGRFLALLATNNPNILELLNCPPDCILHKDPLFDLILLHKDKFITKQCRNSFAGYAIQQIQKAKGLNKKIMKPMEKEKLTPLDFCYAIQGNDTMPLRDYLKEQKLDQKFCGLSKVNHARDVYALFYDAWSSLCFSELDNEFFGRTEIERQELVKYYKETEDYKVKGFKGIEIDNSNTIRVSSIPKDLPCLTNIVYNKDAYTTYCNDYTAYWKWEKERNPERFAETMNHNKGYDAKNMMHCHRLLDVSLEIFTGKGINVRRPNREELLRIRTGEMDYEELLKSANDKIALLDKLADESDLPEGVDKEFCRTLALEIRKQFNKIFAIYEN